MLESKIRFDSPSSYGWVVAFAGFFMHLALGTMYCWGTFTPYVTSYLRKYNGSLGYSDTIIAFLAAPAAQALGMPIGGMIEQKLGPRWTSLIGGWIMSFGVILSAFTTTVSGLVTTYGILYGIGMGIAYMCPIKCGYRWMPKRKGIISGIVVTGFGLGGAVFNIVGASICNPGNKAGDPYFGDDVANRVPTMFTILGCIYALCTTLGALALRDPTDAEKRAIEHEAEAESKEMDEEPYGETNTCYIFCSSSGKKSQPSRDVEMRRPLNPKVHPSATTDKTLQEMLKDPKGYLLFAMMGMTTASGVLVVGTYKTFGASHGISDQFLTFIGSLSLCFNGGGRLLYGYLCDKYGFKLSLLVDFFSQFVIGSFLVASIVSPATFSIVVCLMIMNYGGNFAMYPTVTAEMFGTNHVATNYGFVFAGFAFSSIILKICLSSTFLSYSAVVYGTAIASGIAGGCVFILTTKDLKKYLNWGGSDKK